MDRAMKQSTHQFRKIFFHISKCLACNAKKNIAVEDNKKRINIANFTDIYIQIYIPVLYVMIMTQNKNNSINSILQHGRVVCKNCCVVFPTSGFPYTDPVSQRVQMEGSYHLLSYKD